MVGLELEVMAKKVDRFGWDRDRGTAAHDRLVTDWMDALQDYPLEEVKAACRGFVMDCPGKMPNEGHIVSRIMSARAKLVRALPKPEPDPEEPVDMEERRRIANEIIAQSGFALRGFD